MSGMETMTGMMPEPTGMAGNMTGESDATRPGLSPLGLIMALPLLILGF